MPDFNSLTVEKKLKNAAHSHYKADLFEKWPKKSNFQSTAPLYLRPPNHQIHSNNLNRSNSIIRVQWSVHLIHIWRPNDLETYFSEPAMTIIISFGNW